MTTVTKTERIINSNLSDKQKWKELSKRTRIYCDDMEDYRIKDKITIAKILMNELKVSGNKRKEVEYMISSEFKNFKDLSKNCSSEQIIGLIIFYVMKSHDISLVLEKYKSFKKLGLTNKHYMTFATKLSNYYQKQIPIKIRQPSSSFHENFIK